MATLLAVTSSDFSSSNKEIHQLLSFECIDRFNLHFEQRFSGQQKHEIRSGHLGYKSPMVETTVHKLHMSCFEQKWFGKVLHLGFEEIDDGETHALSCILIHHLHHNSGAAEASRRVLQHHLFPQQNYNYIIHKAESH